MKTKTESDDKEVIPMQARMKNPAMLFPDAMQAMFALKTAIDKGGLPESTAQLVHLRVSQINGCSVCIDMHAHELQKAGESTERLMAVAAWRDAPYFTAAERAALALAEAVTRLSDNPDPVPDAVWDRAARHYDEKQLAALLLSIGLINVWNRLNVSTRQVAGEWKKSAEAREWVEKASRAREQAVAV
ncbi:MAG TPA: carboxymuconolactone decarboxylase family protein [Acidobacteriaceae bacterium]|nr:carboxymuconolactone decarboxylase family protein [Acidobacteriaceae bacterium]